MDNFEWRFARFDVAHGGTLLEVWHFYWNDKQMGEHMLPVALANAIRNTQVVTDV